VRRRRRDGERDRLETELDSLRPYLELAREIHAEVARVAADPSAHGDLLTELIDRIPEDRRLEVAQSIFDRLPAERQWEIVERVFGDDEIAAHLAGERDRLRAVAEREHRRAAVRDAGVLDTRTIAAGEELTLGLFREHDVRPALGRGHAAATCARRLVLRSAGDGSFRVIEDTFNPSGGYFVTAEYDEQTWREHERLDGHTIVRVGSTTDGLFEPVLFPGGRVDVEVGGVATAGRLHLGFAMLSGLDLFVP
jgi:hypothetical protein